MDPTFAIPTGRPSTGQSTDPGARPRDRDGEPIVGSTADSWRAAHARCRRFRTYCVAFAETAATSAFADVEDFSYESPRVRRVDGLLHRPDAHRPSAIC